MRTAFSISGRRDASSAVRAAQLAEEYGLDDVWLTEDYCERGAFALAGAIALSTTKIRIGIGVVNPWTRHPALLAMEFAALDELSHGRAVLGLGASNPRWMTEQLGIAFDRPIGRLAEAVDIVRALLTGDQVTFDGQHFHIATRLAFTPRRTAPPIVLGVKGPRALAMARDRADGILLSVLSSAPYVASVRNRVGPRLELAAYVALSVNEDAGLARNRIRPIVATYLGVHGDHDITRRAGLDPELCDAFRAGWREGVPRTDLVDDDLLQIFAACGTAHNAARFLANLAAAGLDVAVIRDDPQVNPAVTFATARNVMTMARQLR